MPVSLEDKVVNFADNLVSDRSIKTVAQAAERMRSNGFELTATRMEAMGRRSPSSAARISTPCWTKANLREAAAAGCDTLA